MTDATASAIATELVGQSEYGETSAATGIEYTIPGRPTFALELRRAGTAWTVEDMATGIHGAGETPTDALDDFRAAASEHRDVLERQDALAEDLARQLEYLRVRLTS